MPLSDHRLHGSIALSDIHTAVVASGATSPSTR